MWSKISIRMRLTIIVTVMLSCCSAFLVIVSIVESQNIYAEAIINKFIEENEEQDLNTTVSSNPDINNTKNDNFQPENESESIENIGYGYEASVVVWTGELEQSFYNRMIIVMIIIIIIASISTYFLSSRMIKPIKRLQQNVSNIDEYHLDTAIYIPKSKDEVKSLALSFATLIDRLKTAFQREKQFSRDVAHELKTPITSIKANCQVVQLDEDSSLEEYKETIDIIMQQVSRMENLIQDMMDFYSGNYHLDSVSIDVRSLFEKIIDEQLILINQKNITANIEGELNITGDELLIKRLFNNLISNAIRYNKENGKIKINLSDKRIIIEDTGIGIDKQYIDHIFEPFYCVDSSHSRQSGGSGLGLALVKQICDIYRMNIIVESVVSVGTKFIIENEARN